MRESARAQIYTRSAEGLGRLNLKLSAGGRGTTLGTIIIFCIHYADMHISYVYSCQLDCNVSLTNMTTWLVVVRRGARFGLRQVKIRIYERSPSHYIIARSCRWE